MSDAVASPGNVSAVATAACFVPALRASHFDPLVACTTSEVARQRARVERQRLEGSSSAFPAVECKAKTVG